MNPDSSPQVSPVSLVEAAQLVVLDPAQLRFSQSGATLHVTLENDRSIPRASVVCAFPLSEPGKFLSVRDGSDSEVGMILDPSQLSAGCRRLVDAELARRYLVPGVSRIRSAKERFGTVDWVMETDRGVCEFTTRNLRENVQRPSTVRIILSDVDGNRYDIRNLDALDPHSQDLLFRHL